MYLRRGFHAYGEVNFAGAQVFGQMSCAGGTFENKNADRTAFFAFKLHVRQSFFWRNIYDPKDETRVTHSLVVLGKVDLASASVGDLVDEVACWPKKAGQLRLDGFVYNKITGLSVDISERLEWLEAGSNYGNAFQPQPYSQLSKVLRTMGLQSESRQVLIEQRKRLNQFSRQKFGEKLISPPSRRIQPPVGDELNIPWPRWVVSSYSWLWAGVDIIVRAVVGYGYAPFRSIGWLLGLWLIASLMASAAWDEGSMVPNSDVVLTSPGWIAVEAQADAAHVWSRGAGRDYESFSPAQWGFDAVVPIITVGQTDAWAPSTARGAWGTSLWWGRWLLGIAGWIVAALAAAAVTGIIRKDDE
ncbi:MAG: hypothetical protein R3D60_10145 [Paracoccaceae bacterium]